MAGPADIESVVRRTDPFLNVSSQKFMYISIFVLLTIFLLLGIGDHEYVMIRVVPEDVFCSLSPLFLAECDHREQP